MPINDTNETIIHPVTHQVIPPGGYYEGAAHQGSESLHNKKSLAALEKAENKAAEEVSDEETPLTDAEKLEVEIEEAEKIREQYRASQAGGAAPGGE